VTKCYFEKHVGLISIPINKRCLPLAWLSLITIGYFKIFCHIGSNSVRCQSRDTYIVLLRISCIMELGLSQEQQILMHGHECATPERPAVRSWWYHQIAVLSLMVNGTSHNTFPLSLLWMAFPIIRLKIAVSTSSNSGIINCNINSAKFSDCFFSGC
jgi:hypothetical protein